MAIIFSICILTVKAANAIRSANSMRIIASAINQVKPAVGKNPCSRRYILANRQKCYTIIYKDFNH